MRRVHAVMTLAATVAAAAALAAPAMAHEFNSPQGPSEPRAVGVGAQSFVFRPFRVTCESARSVTAGQTTTWPSPTLTLQVKYSKCKTHAGKVGKTEGPAIPTHFEAPVTLTYHANGYVDVGSIAITVGGNFKCKIATEPQTIPAKAVKHPTEEFTAATFLTESIATKSKKLPLQEVVSVSNGEVKRIHYTLEEGFCEELEMPTGTGGSYSGVLQASISKANLNWK
jgi:hypothetical protein